jgi:splicing factor U2AF subunit
MKLGDKQLVVQQANIGLQRSAAGFPLAPGAMPIPGMGPPVPMHLLGLMSEVAPLGGTPAEPSTVVQLLNMVTPEELADDQEYQGR